MAIFTLVIEANTLPTIEGERLRASVTNVTQGGPPQQFVGPPDTGKFNASYEANYGDEISVVRDFVLGTLDGPDTEAITLTLPFPVLPVPTGGGVSVLPL
jgi:hypothetical protein